MERADLEIWKAREVARLLSLVENERRYYQEIIASLPVGLVVLSGDLSVISSNNAARGMLVAPDMGEGRRRRPASLLPQTALDAAEDVLNSGNAVSGVPVETAHEPRRSLRVSIQPIRSWGNEAEQEALLTIEDVSGLVLRPETATRALPATELLAQLDAAVWAVELPSMEFLYASERAEELLGFPAAHWLNTAGFWAARIHPADRDSVLEEYAHAFETRDRYACEYRALRSDGQPLWVRETTRVLRDETGQAKHLIGATSAFAGRRRAEDQWARAGRMEALAKLAGRVSHDLNNLLMIVAGYGEELLNRLDPASPLRTDLEAILSATRRLGSLGKHLLAFTRQGAAEPGAVDLRALLRGLRSRLESAWGNAGQLEIESSEEPVWARAQAGILEDLIAAVAASMRSIAPPDSKLAVRVARHLIEEHTRNGGLRPGEHGCIAIEVDGVAPASAEALFEAWLPSKEGGEALAQGYFAIRQWGGHVAILERPGQGVSIEIFLQAAEREAAAASKTVNAPVILVVEDEEGIRALVRKVLKRQGYEVLETGSAEEAIEMAAGRAGAIDMLITDVMLPGISGPELAERLREARGPLKALFLSGYPGPTPEPARLPEGAAFLQKPFTLGALVEQVKTALAR
jgi:CheY-like chemotaxis protein